MQMKRRQTGLIGQRGERQVFVQVRGGEGDHRLHLFERRFHFLMNLACGRGRLLDNSCGV